MADFNGNELQALVDSLDIESEALVPATLVLAANDKLAALRARVASLGVAVGIAESRSDDDDVADLLATVREEMEHLAEQAAAHGQEIDDRQWVEVDEIECPTCECLFTPVEYARHTNDRPAWCSVEARTLVGFEEVGQ